MDFDFSTLKKESSSQLDHINKQIEKFNQDGRKADERFWSPTVDKAGNGYAVIRFLPKHPQDELPFVRIWDHGFQGPGGWYIENSLTTIGQNDPCSEFNSKLWNASSDDNSPERKQARKQKRRLHYISNILVIEDESNPESQGKVFLFKYGKKIW